VSDASEFKIMLPSVLYAVGDAGLVRVLKSTAMDPNHPALQFVDWYVKQRGLVAVVIDSPRDDDRFHEGCVCSVYMTAANRMSLLEEPA